MFQHNVFKTPRVTNEVNISRIVETSSENQNIPFQRGLLWVGIGQPGLCDHPKPRFIANLSSVLKNLKLFQKRKKNKTPNATHMARSRSSRDELMFRNDLHPICGREIYSRVWVKKKSSETFQKGQQRNVNKHWILFIYWCKRHLPQAGRVCLLIKICPF